LRFPTIYVLIGVTDSVITNPVFGVSGRPINPADDVEQPFRWFQECLDNHEACGKAAREGLDGNVTLPTRLVHVPTAESENPRLVATSGQTGRYLALSYRWGTATITKTLKDNLDTHLKSIPASTLSKTFQDALIITRRLGFQYIWIDSLCIIQDSPLDWAREAMQMASIYTNAAMTISASVSDSADSGLFYSHTVDYSPKLTLRSIGGTAVAEFFLTTRSVPSFEADVEKGTLSNRGWCLQERLLSRRILHFGTNQLHWECLSGVWSASSAKNLADDPSRTLNNRFLGASSLPLAIPKETPTLFAELRQVYAHQPHGTWYHMLRDYTSRSLTNSSDKLPALAGLAAAFAEKTKDVYLNGLWMHGLPEGLLWSSPGLGFNDLDSKSNLSAPNGHRAPTWSWASLDGEIEYPIGRLGYIDAELEGFTAPTRAEEGRVLHYEEHENRLFSDPNQVLIMKGKLKSLSELRGFRAEDREVVEQAKDLNITCRMPHLRFDDPERDRWDVHGVFALFIGQVGCGTDECEHASDCSYGWGYGLLLEPLPIFTAGMVCCVRVGVVQCYSGDFNDCGDERIGLK